MNIKEFDEKYYFHDSLIDKISYDENKRELTFVFDFCFWAQQGYKKEEKENGMLKVVFNGVESYDGPVGNDMSNWWSVLDGDIKDGKYHFFIEDVRKDVIDSEYFDIYINAENVEVEDLR